MKNMPISTAAVTWFDKSGGLHIRVYSSDGYTVSERCADAGSASWTNGSFSEPGSQVSAICWQDSAGEHVRVYATFEDGTTEWCNDPTTGWTKGGYTTQ